MRRPKITFKEMEANTKLSEYFDINPWMIRKKE